MSVYRLAMNSIIQQLFEHFLDDFIYYGTPTGNEKETLSLYVEPDCTSEERKRSFPLREKLTEELFAKLHRLCSKCVNSAGGCVNESCTKDAESQKKENHLFLILGGSGIGKTASALNLTKFYWDKITKFPSSLKYKSISYDANVIPIYINLESVKGNWSNVLQSYLQTKGMEDLTVYDAVCKMKNVLLILDGYDEIATSYMNDASGEKNIWDNNNWGDLNFKAVIFSRPECFESFHKMQEFFYYTKSGHDVKLSAKKFFIQPYTDEHINKYMNQFINLLSITPKVCVKTVDSGNMFVMTKFVTHGTKWETKRSPYYKWFGQNELSPVPQLKQLAKNPLLLTLLMLVLPGVASRVKDDENEMMKICSTETGLYDEFLSQWFSFQCKKFENSKKGEEFAKILDYLPKLFGMYAQNLATFVLKKCGGYSTDNYQSTERDTLKRSLLEPYHDERLRNWMKNDETIQKFLSDDKDEHIKILRNGCPLHFYYKNNFPRDKFQCRFIHISLIEFLASRDVFQYVRGEIQFFIYREIAQFNANNSQRHFHLSNDSIGITYQAINGPKAEPKILYFLADRAKNNKEFSDLLLEIVKISSETSTITLSPRNRLEVEQLNFSLLQRASNGNNEKEIYIQDELKQLAANCMTILILSERNFSDENLRNVQIPGADLRNGIFVGADLRGANCERCQFGHSMLTNAKLQGSNLKDITVGQDKLWLDDSPCMISCFDSFLYCSFFDKIVQYDLDSGEIVRDFVIEKHPNFTYAGDLIEFEFTVSSKKLFVWSDDIDSILVFDLETGRPLVSILEDRFPTVMQGVIQLFPYDKNENSFPSSESYTSRQNVLRLYNVPSLNVIVVTVSSTHNPKKTICFAWTAESQVNIESLFPIYCNFKGCAVSVTRGYFALAEEDGVKIYSLFTCNIIHGFIDVSWPVLDSVIVKFSQGGRFLGILCKEDRSSSSNFHLLHTTNDKIETIDMTDCFSEIEVPDTYIFSNNDANMLATAHEFFNGSHYIHIWTVVDNQLTLLQKNLNYDPNPWTNRLSSIQYSFCRDDTSVGHLSAFSGTNEISIVSIHDLRSHFTIKKSEPTVASVAVSNDGKSRAILSYVYSETDHKMNLEIFENQMNFPKLVTHETFYPTKLNSLSRRSLNDVSFDQTNKFLLAIGTDLMLFFVCVRTGSIKGQVNLLTSGPLIEETYVFIKHSNFEILTQSHRLIVMYSHKTDQTSEYSDFFAMWNFDEVNQNEILKREFLDVRNIETATIEGICQDFDGNWVAAHNRDEIFIWSTENVTKFRIFRPSQSKYFDQNPLNCVKFGPEADSDSVHMIFVRFNEINIMKVSENTIEICKRIKDDESYNFGGIVCVNNSLCFATFTQSHFYLRDMEDKKLCVPLKLWYQPDGCRLISIIENDIVDQNHFLIHSWGMQSNENYFSCIKMNYRSGWWKIVWSSKPPYELQAADCNIGNCYELNSNSFTSLLKFGIKGKPYSQELANETRYIPFPYLFSAYITEEERSERKDPIIVTNRGERFCITENSWTISAAIKKYSNKCSKQCITPHMFLIIEGMRNGQRFILKAHKRIINRIVIVTLEKMYDIARFRDHAKTLKANQWEITRDEGMMIIRSIQDDQQTENLKYSLLNENCVVWGRSKIQLIPRYHNVGQKKFLRSIRDLIVPPRYLLNAN